MFLQTLSKYSFSITSDLRRFWYMYSLVYGLDLSEPEPNLSNVFSRVAR
jgi:hypothetical protein